MNKFHKTFLDLLQEIEDYQQEVEPSFSGEFAEELPLLDETDNAILMHRDAHFGGKFETMLDYYRREGKGVRAEFDFDHINQLFLIEQKLQKNLAGMILSGMEAERVAAARNAYQKLRDVYSSDDPIAKTIADLILSEEEFPEEEIHAVVATKEDVIPILVELVRNDTFYDPLFPGYGQAPLLAIQCLGKLGDMRAIIALFEMIGHGDFAVESLILEALKKLGEPAKEFLIERIRSRPITHDNERAALALVSFGDDPLVCRLCLEELADPEVLKKELLTTYLSLVCQK